jgi:amylosucrase
VYNPKSASILQSILADKADAISADSAFYVRISARFSAIHRLSTLLWGEKQLPTDFYGRLVQLLYSRYTKRSKTLKKQDQRRMNNPHWFLSQEIVGMMMYTDRFAGNLEGFQSKLGYLQDLGVNLVHLMPLMSYPEVNNDGGYAVSDFQKVHPALGGVKELRKTADWLRQHDMLLMLDFAVNHTSEEHEWAAKARKGEKKYQEYYYFFPDRTVPDLYEQTLPEVFPENAPGNFTYIKEIDHWVMTVFHNYQWDLNYHNPEVFLEMLDNLLWLANIGVDIVRLDALAFTWKKIGTDSQNLPEAHLLMKLFKACCQVVSPSTLFLAEAIVAPHEIVKYFGEVDPVSDECDLAYNATAMTLSWEMIATKNHKLWNVSIDHVPMKPTGATWLNYIRCHDDIGLGYDDQHAAIAGYDPGAHRRFITDFFTRKIDWSFASGAEFMKDPGTGNARISGSLASLAGLETALEKNDPLEIALAEKRILLLHAFILSYAGIPMLYMGDELAMTNDYSYQNDPTIAGDNRWMHRPRMNWKLAEKRGDKVSVTGRVFQSLKRLIEVRKNEPLFADSSNLYRMNTRNQHLLAYERYSDTDKIVCVYNLNDHPETLYGEVLERQGFSLGSLREVISNEELIVINRNLTLEPYQFLWIKRN